MWKRDALLTLGLHCIFGQGADTTTAWSHHHRTAVTRNFWQAEGADKYIK